MFAWVIVRLRTGGPSTWYGTVYWDRNGIEQRIFQRTDFWRPRPKMSSYRI